MNHASQWLFAPTASAVPCDETRLVKADSYRLALSTFVAVLRTAFRAAPGVTGKEIEPYSHGHNAWRMTGFLQASFQ